MFESITLAHGGGGRETSWIIENFILKHFKDYSSIRGGYGLDLLDDSAVIPIGRDEYMLFTIDSYTVNPIFFPGGDIGSLAIIGSINDVAVMGGEPKAIVSSLVVEEGFPLRELDKILYSMREAIKRENVALIGGDFKVMSKGQIDKLVVTTACIGFTKKEDLLVIKKVREGDKLVVTGPIGLHGATILALQSGVKPEELPFKSDLSPLTKAIKSILRVGGVHKARDLTRGGLSMGLNDFARSNGLTVVVYEDKIPVDREVIEFTEMLGVNVYDLACEGTALISVEEDSVEEVVSVLRENGYPRASIIGEVRRGKPGYVLLKTRTGGFRILEPPSGEIVPRIC